MKILTLFFEKAWEEKKRLPIEVSGELIFKDVIDEVSNQLKLKINEFTFSFPSANKAISALDLEKTTSEIINNHGNVVTISKGIVVEKKEKHEAKKIVKKEEKQEAKKPVDLKEDQDATVSYAKIKEKLSPKQALERLGEELGRKGAD
ncbi:MAG: hypothetical protein KAR35_04760, partial [Candidatus Heimdallarchaeota archaeon]|nr:hypothetical protein [Candidatus Heimdallarchaeota archaeon]MCK5048666.1 hypothetical protein [Candidatus Heimdallarchaeota archaeon]